MKAIIKMRLEQSIDGEKEVTETTYYGLMRQWGEDRVLVNFKDESGTHQEMEINVQEERVIVTRNREADNKVIYGPGEKCSIVFRSEVGSMDLTFVTKAVQIDTMQDGAYSVRLVYEIRQYDSCISENIVEMFITVAI